MNGISIPINIDRSQLQAAIQQIKELHSAMGTLGNVPGLSLPGMETNPQAAKMWQDMQQSQTRGVGSGNNDMLKQFSGMDAATRRIATNFDRWHSAAAKAKSELKQITADLNGLNKASLDPKLAPGSRSAMLDEIGQLTERRKELEKEAAKAETRANEYQRRLPEGFNRTQSSNQTNQNSQDNNTSNQWGGIGRLLKYGLAAAGGFSVASFLQQSRGEYRHALSYESPLFAKGITGSRDRAGTAAQWGVNPMDYLHAEQRLSESTGLNEKTGIGKHALLTASFAKSSGIDIGQAAGLRETVYQTTGKAGDLSSAVLLAVSKTTKEGIDKSQLPELLTLVGRNTQATAQAMGGAGLNEKQMANGLK